MFSCTSNMVPNHRRKNVGLWPTLGHCPQVGGARENDNRIITGEQRSRQNNITLL